MSTLLRYMALRLLIFGICFGVLWMLFGSTLVSNWLLALLALLFTSGLSMLLLRRQGAEAATAMGGAVGRVRGRFERSVEESRRKEDAELDQDAEAAAEPAVDEQPEAEQEVEQTEFEQPGAEQSEAELAAAAQPDSAPTVETAEHTGSDRDGAARSHSDR